VSFAKTYLERYASGSGVIEKTPDPDVFFMVVIPVCNEPDLHLTLDSIERTLPGQFSGEIILVINQSEADSEPIRVQNEITIEAIDQRVNQTLGNWSTLLINAGDLPKGKAGPGLARKIGMDEAVYRFQQLDRPQGIIVSLDADTLVEPDYFSRLFELCQSYPDLSSYVCYFEHQDRYASQSVSYRQAILEYEIYLWLTKLALRWAGYPGAIHSLGSAFGTRANTYVKVGGMGIQQSGEDFYFLQKCFKQGGLWELNSLRVYPADRPSDRVLFGTGPFIREYSQKHSKGFTKYSWRAFCDLREVLTQIQDLTYPLPDAGELFNVNWNEKPVVTTLDWEARIKRAASQAGDSKSFGKWLWRELDGFQMIRYLNVHQGITEAKPVTETASHFLNEIECHGCSRDKKEILNRLQTTQKSLGDFQVS